MTVEAPTQRLKHGTDVPQLREALEEFTASSGYQFYTYITGRVVGGRRVTNLDPREKPFHLSNVPGEWESQYSRKRYYDQDPIMLFALSNLMPESWSNIVRRSKMTPKQNQIINEARDSGLGDGVIIPVHGPGGEFAVLSLTHGESVKQSQTNVELDDTALHMFALRFHNIVRARNETSPSEMPADLTNREIDVLFWTAEGKSSWDISQILSISESTVNFHINSAKRKLGVYSKPHAVARMFSFQDRELF